MRHLDLRRGAGSHQYDTRYAVIWSLLVVGVGTPVNCWVLGMAVRAGLFLFFRCLRLPSFGMVCDVMV